MINLSSKVWAKSQGYAWQILGAQSLDLPQPCLSQAHAT